MLTLDTCSQDVSRRLVRRRGAPGRSERQPRRGRRRGRLAHRGERQREVDDREDDPSAAPGDARNRSASTVRTSRLAARACATYYGDVQGVFQDPFSSYNPIFKADRVFSLLRGEHFSGLSGSEWSDEGPSVARGREPEPGRRPRQVPAPAQRRAAPAHAHRTGPAAGHPPPRRRRDHQHARRLHAHRRAQPARRPEVARPRRPLHHARPLARQLHQRPDRDPAPGQVVEVGTTEQVFGNPSIRTRDRSWRPCLSCTRSGRTSKSSSTRARRMQTWTRCHLPTTGYSSRSSPVISSGRRTRPHVMTDLRREHAGAAAEESQAPIPLGGAPARQARRGVALEPESGHRAQPHPPREQHLQLGGRALWRRVRRGVPRRRHRADDEPPRGHGAPTASRGRSTTSRSPSSRPTTASTRSRADSSSPTTRASPGSRIATT